MKREFNFVTGNKPVSCFLSWFVFFIEFPVFYNLKPFQKLENFLKFKLETVFSPVWINVLNGKTDFSKDGHGFNFSRFLFMSGNGRCTGSEICDEYETCFLSSTGKGNFSGSSLWLCARVCPRQFFDRSFQFICLFKPFMQYI